ncbi:sorbitol-binding protein /mannitol-binding protein [Loktanella fryxellensis]|uniref:Sorbitol-binding protein /mannitol-binding protein n=1 Tax=Loktanella fryxellensis TaxID=245187 RepID=A0A1H8CUZ5_9RHOB|nr:sugar ABC transporter substrate-binding protein [Loktanella fryxellensis]SEM98855.1 sorbitol-binding protein /mannitol-binding protein [Loktanella fryxellensis]
MILKSALWGSAAGVCLAAGLATIATAEEITIATVNNGDMVRMQALSPAWEEQTGNTINWVVLEENVLRQNVTTDISTGGGQYDVMTIGTYEAPIWGANDWLVSLNDGMADDWNADDLLPAIRGGLTVDGTLVAAPFYGESSMVMYRRDLMEAAGLEMPEAPTWQFIREAAAAMTDRDADINGICARGKAGWGENMAFLTAMSNSFGARWFDMDWTAQFDSPEWAETLTFYLEMMAESGPAGAANNGFNENLTLFQQGKCGMWIDATVAASFVTNPEDSTVADQVGFALAPDTGLGKRGNWLWAWSLAIPASSDKQEIAKDFISWATGPGYTTLVAENEGWANVPPGTRQSLYDNAEYLAAAPFAQMTLDSINSADPTAPSVQEVPYTGVQFVAIPEFAGIATQVGQQFSDALAGNMTAEEALAAAQTLTTEEMEAAGY